MFGECLKDVVNPGEGSWSADKGPKTQSDSSCCFILLLMQILSKKVFTLYSLAMQQLSKQDHYDFGLRSLTSLLRYAGRKRRTVSNVPDEEVKL